MICEYLSSTIGKKKVMGLTGAGLSLFVLGHMGGNLLIFAGPEAYNTYGHKLITNPFLYAIEAGLAAIFLIHMSVAFNLVWMNRRARPEGYHGKASGEKNVTTLAAKTMWVSGAVVFVFTVLHLITFKYGAIYWASYHGVKMRDLHRLVLEVFHSPVYVAWYVVALGVLGVHMRHGVSSIFQSLGLNHPKYTPAIKVIGVSYALIVAAGFISQPLYVFLQP